MYLILAVLGFISLGLSVALSMIISSNNKRLFFSNFCLGTGVCFLTLASLI